MRLPGAVRLTCPAVGAAVAQSRADWGIEIETIAACVPPPGRRARGLAAWRPLRQSWARAPCCNVAGQELAPRENWSRRLPARRAPLIFAISSGMVRVINGARRLGPRAPEASNASQGRAGFFPSRVLYPPHSRHKVRANNSACLGGGSACDRWRC